MTFKNYYIVLVVVLSISNYFFYFIINDALCENIFKIYIDLFILNKNNLKKIT
jgi:hypothetical protein